MKVIITESKLTSAIHSFLESSYDGFEGYWIDWSNYGSDLGECCDPYAISFITPNEQSYDNFMFKLVDSNNYSPYGDGYPSEWMDEMPEPCDTLPDIKDPNFDAIVLSEDLYDKLNNFFSGKHIWMEPLITIINEIFGLNVTKISHVSFN